MTEFVCVERNHKNRKNTICGMTFNNKEDFDEHMRRVHGAK
jgi:hypothetical protein